MQAGTVLQPLFQMVYIIVSKGKGLSSAQTDAIMG